LTSYQAVNTWVTKRALISVVLPLLVCLSACAKRPYIIGPYPREKKLIVLPEEGREPTLSPYVVNGEKYYPVPNPDGFVEVGKASWYGRTFHGRPTASGEIYNMYKESAAHKTLPMGTYVKVVNLSNGRQIIVKINDRGPFVKGRIIDLSYAAGRKIGLIGPGVADVKITALGRMVGNLKSPTGLKPVVEVEDLKKGEFTVQVGAFKSKENALRLADRLKVIFDVVDVALYEDAAKGPLYRVRVSRTKTLAKAGKIEKRLEEMGFQEAFVLGL
jgi:rare lipoprotein A